MKMQTVLIIEDDDAVRQILARRLAAPGRETMQASDGVRGLAEARLCHPDVIVLDVGLPGIDGHSICKVLRADPDLLHIPILMLTGLGPDVEKTAIEEGVDAFLTKPFNFSRLAARVEMLLQRRSAESAS